MFSMVKRGESCARPLATFSVHSERHEPGTCMPACQQFLSSMLLSNMLLWATNSGRALPLASDTSWQKLRNSAMPTCALNGCDKDSHRSYTPTATHTDTQCTAAGRISALDFAEDLKPPHCTVASVFAPFNSTRQTQRMAGCFHDVHRMLASSGGCKDCTPVYICGSSKLSVWRGAWSWLLPATFRQGAG